MALNYIPLKAMKTVPYLPSQTHTQTHTEANSAYLLFQHFLKVVEGGNTAASITK